MCVTAARAGAGVQVGGSDAGIRMKLELDNLYLITSNNWFYAPDGELYRAVFGTVTAILADDEALGIRTNRGSTNWYVVIGNMMIAGCEVQHCIKTEWCSSAPNMTEIKHEGKVFYQKGRHPDIYFSDA